MKKDDVLRKCIVTGKVQEKDKMLRFTVTPDLQVIPDFKKKLPGRGIYVMNAKKALETAVSKNLFAKALKDKARVTPELTALVESLLRKNALSSISLARKAGVLVTGMEKVLDVLRHKQAAFILEASDAAEDGHGKILAAAGDIPMFRLFDTEELDQALNKTSTVHAAFKKGDMAKKVSHDLEKLAGFLNS